jgi:hypothetical protein
MAKSEDPKQLLLRVETKIPVNQRTLLQSVLGIVRQRLHTHVTFCKLFDDLPDDFGWYMYTSTADG